MKGLVLGGIVLEVLGLEALGPEVHVLEVLVHEALGLEVLVLGFLPSTSLCLSSLLVHHLARGRHGGSMGGVGSRQGAEGNPPEAELEPRGRPFYGWVPPGLARSGGKA